MLPHWDTLYLAWVRLGQLPCPWQLGAAGQQPAVAAGQAVRLGQAVLGRLGRLSVMVVTTVTIVKCPSHSDTVTQ